MVDIKCKNCNKLLMKADLLAAAIKCSRCGMIFEYKLLSNTYHLTNDSDPELTKNYLQNRKANVNMFIEPQEADPIRGI